MSKRDHGLLEAAGLSAAEVATLFQRSRQAVYQGLSQNSNDYVSAKDALFVLSHAKRTRSPRLEELINFIATNYSPSESEVILPSPMAQAELGPVLSEADQIIVVFNGNTENVAPTTAFAKILVDLVATRSDVLDFVVPGEWVPGYFEQNLKLKLDGERVTIDDKVAYIPSFIVTSRANEQTQSARTPKRAEVGDAGYQRSFHAFFCTRLSMEEVRPTDAERLWNYYWPMCEKNSQHKQRVAG